MLKGFPFVFISCDCHSAAGIWGSRFLRLPLWLCPVKRWHSMTKKRQWQSKLLTSEWPESKEGKETGARMESYTLIQGHPSSELPVTLVPPPPNRVVAWKP